jgi:steroid delta-isomerase-like uncharacterized protein
MTAEENQAVVRRLFDEVWNQGKDAAVDELLTPETLFYSPLSPQPRRGTQPLKEYMHYLHGTFPDIHYTVDQMFGEGDRVAVRWTSRQTHSRPFMGSPPTGKQLVISAIEFFQVTDGRIQNIWLEVDLPSTMKQLGFPVPDLPF